MKIVIEIDEDTYRYMQSRCKYQNKGDKGLSKFEEVGVAIKNGRLLPQIHGRLIILSEDAVKREQVPLGFSCQDWISEVGLSNVTVAIIEADECTYEETGCGSCKRQLDCPIEADRAENEV